MSYKNINKIENTQTNNLKSNLQFLGILLLASVLASLAGIPYSSSFIDREASESPVYSLLIGELFNFILLTVPLTTLGLWLGPKVGLGAPNLRELLIRNPEHYRHFQSLVLPAVSLGIAGGIVTHVVSVLSEPFLPSELTKFESPGVLPALLGSLGAAINEEIWMRLGTMTFLVWLGSKITGQSKPGKILVWSANLIAALAFGALHLPQVALVAKGLTTFMLVFVLLTNGFLGLIFGWLYWQYGLLAAAIAHFSTDLVIHVIPAMFHSK